MTTFSRVSGTQAREGWYRSPKIAMQGETAPESHREVRVPLLIGTFDSAGLYTRDMSNLRIETEGLTLREAVELEKIIATFDGVETAKFTPVLPGTMERRSFPPQAAAHILHILIRLTEGAAGGVGFSATQHAYKRVGEGLVDRAWDAIKGKFSGSSAAEVEIKLYGPDGQLVKLHKGRR